MATACSTRSPANGRVQPAKPRWCSAPGEKLEIRIADRRLDPLEGFPHRAFSQADHPEARYAAADINFDLDRKGIDPGERAGKYAGEQIGPHPKHASREL